MFRKRIFLAIFFLGLFTLGLLHWAFPVQYRATGTLQIRLVKQTFLSDDQSQTRYDEFIATQIALMRSSIVIDRALEMPEVAKLPIILKQKDRRAWLQEKLRIERKGHSEVVNVSIRTNTEDASEKIVNAVIDSYFNFIEDMSRQTGNNMITNLNSEKRQLTLLAQQLQDSIRVKTKQAAAQETFAGRGTEQIELLRREAVAADVALTILKAERKAVTERIEQLSGIPLSVLVQIEPEVALLGIQKEALWKQKKKLTQDDPHGVELLQQIKELEDKISKVAAETDADAIKEIRDSLRAQEGKTFSSLERQIRAKEILVESLTEQLVKSIERVDDILDTAFDQKQLDRANKTLNQIEDRLVAIRSEQRAPAQIIPLSRAVSSRPQRWWR